MTPNEPKPDETPQPGAEGTEFLVREVRTGEAKTAWNKLSVKIVEYLRTRFGHASFPHGVEFQDFVSDAMLKVLTSIDTFEHRGKDSFWKWVQTVAGNLWRDYWRRHDRDRKLGLVGPGSAGAGEDRPPAAVDVAPALGETPTQIVRFRELEKAEQDCVAKLPKHLHEAYVMRRVQELSFAEIAEKTGVANEATLRSHYMRARDKVRECLGSKLDELGTRISGWQ